MLFPALPMGAEEYYIFIAPNNREYTPGAYEYFNGKRVGVDKGSVQADIFLAWARNRGIEAELVEVTTGEAETFRRLMDGELDAFVTLDAYGAHDTAVPAVSVGSSDFFFAVSKDRPDLLEELNAALSRVQDENRFYNQQMFQKYISTTGANLFLSASEQDWLSTHGTIRVGYQDNYLSFCAADEKTGELKGALKDYLELAADCHENAHLDFQAVAYPNAEAAMEALRSGAVDCMFPSNLSSSDGETMNLVMTPAMMRTEVYAIVRKADLDTFAQKESVTAAIEQNDPNYDAVLQDHFPTWQAARYADMQACLRAVAEGKADCVLISNYQYNNLGKLCERYQLAPMTTGKEVDYAFAVNRGDTELYSILARTTNIVSNASINASLTYYSAQDARTTLADFIRDNLAVVLSLAGIMLAMAAVLIQQQRVIRARRRADESRRAAESLHRQVFVDPLTRVRNRGAFNNYIQNLQDRLTQGETLTYAIGVFDCDSLKLINDQYGHEKGDEYLKAASRLICRTFQHSPVFRTGGDEFAVILQNDDYQRREELARRFEETRAEICAAAENRWDEVHLSLGVAVYDPQADLSVSDTVRRADKLMYENKNANKARQRQRASQA